MSDEHDCLHCPDGHDDPRRKPWGAFLAADVDSDGQPTHLIVSTSDGSHVAESDARWLRKLIREHREHSALPGKWDQ
jgi:hypothetical protein